jgi:hypothetical protein
MKGTAHEAKGFPNAQESLHPNHSAVDVCVSIHMLTVQNEHRIFSRSQGVTRPASIVQTSRSVAADRSNVTNNKVN